MKLNMKLLLCFSMIILGSKLQVQCDCDSDNYEPVCGANGKTYFDDCALACDEVVESYPGVCVGCNCPDVLLPVCGDDGFSYINSCEANCHQATVVSRSQCGRNCNCANLPEDPVCATNNRTYRNLCELRCDGATGAYRGSCRPRGGCNCNRFHIDPVCDVNGRTYRNACYARCVHAIIDPTGQCSGVSNDNLGNLYWHYH